MSECKIRLLMETPASNGGQGSTIVLCGRQWMLVEYDDIAQAPPYSCVSYAWGISRVASPIHPSQAIAQRTIPTLETVIRFAQSRENWANNVDFSYARDPVEEERGQTSALVASKAFWVDALCVPLEEPARMIALESMGAIFASAHQVFAVLTSACAAALETLRIDGKIGQTELAILEGEGWLSRAWTYQETVNSQRLYFVAETNERVAFAGLDLLNSVLDASDAWRVTSGLNAFEWSEQHPCLDSLQQLIADYRIAEYQERSAYQVMCAMHGRVAERSEDAFYAMIGAITTEATDNRIARSPAEYFRDVCEAKGDYSFIFCVGNRLAPRGRRWCPEAINAIPVVSGLLMSGERLVGRYVGDYLVLDNVCQLTHGKVSDEGIKALTSFAQRAVTGLDVDAIASILLDILRKKGFTGCGAYIELANGLFFSQSPILEPAELLVAVSPDIVWTGGAPALIVYERKNGIHEFVDVGAFVGRVPASGQSFKLD